MATSGKKTVIVIAFIITFLLLWVGFNIEHNKKIIFESESIRVSNFSQTTQSRIMNSVITLPDTHVLIGLKDGRGEYTDDGRKGTATIKSEYLKTEFIPGNFQINKSARLDAIVPVEIRNESEGSIYIFLFQDRGDAALLKSYARLGDSSSIAIQNIKTVPKDTVQQDYMLVVSYRSGNTSKEVSIPVVDGHFDPSNTISK